MIIDLKRFIDARQPLWDELDARLHRMEEDPGAKATLRDVERMHYLYQAAASDLSRIETFAAEVGLKRRLEALVARAHMEIHEIRHRPNRFSPALYFLIEFPRVWRRHAMAFWLATAAMMIGGLFGGGAFVFDPGAKEFLIGPFTHLSGRPSDRVAQEEKGPRKELGEQRSRFSAMLMTNNIRVSINTMALGMLWGLGSIIMLFYNGVILGVICADYILDGQGVFLTGWLLPHGSVEIPSILIAGQAGLTLGRALIGWRDRKPLRRRMREIAPDLGALITGVAVLLVWAGIIEAFFSQYHEPVIPYAVKIGFGAIELMGLFAFLALAGRKPDRVAARREAYA